MLRKLKEILYTIKCLKKYLIENKCEYYDETEKIEENKKVREEKYSALKVFTESYTGDKKEIIENLIKVGVNIYEFNNSVSEEKLERLKKKITEEEKELKEQTEKSKEFISDLENKIKYLINNYDKYNGKKKYKDIVKEKVISPNIITAIKKVTEKYEDQDDFNERTISSDIIEELS